MQEPRDPLLKVVSNFALRQINIHYFKQEFVNFKGRLYPPFKKIKCTGVKIGLRKRAHAVRLPASTPHKFINDPSAGSPTETLLRLLLPLNDQV
jgi:hypothetical protein